VRRDVRSEKGLRYLPRAVARAVVDDEELVVRAELAHDRLEGAEQALLPVPGGNGDGEAPH
jgi:hypothetical protein